MKAFRLVTTAAVLLPLLPVPFAHAGLGRDDMRCYQMKDPISLSGLADIASDLGLDEGCKLGKARYFCEPADPGNVSAVDKKTGPIRNKPDITGPDCGDTSCYKVSCPAPETPLEDMLLSDQFGTRTVTGMKTSLLCVPAMPRDYRPTTNVSYHLSVSGTDGSPPLPLAIFDGGSGLEAIRARSKHMPAYPGDLRFAPASLIGGTVNGSTDAWAAWHAAAIEVGEYCETHTEEECATAWDTARVARIAVLSAVTDKGVVLASWQLSDVWPSGLTVLPPDGTGVGGGILRLSLSAGAYQFSFATNATVSSLFDGTSPPSADAPTAEDGETEMDTFLARYHSVGEELQRLNGLELLADPPSPPTTPVPAFSTGEGTFTLEVDGVAVAKFRSISGLESEVEVIEYKDGDDPITHKRAGKAKYKNIVLKRGFVNDASLLEWYKKVLAGATDRKSGSIIYLGREGNEVVRFSITDATPIRWKAPELNSHSDTHIVEEIEFVVEKVERA